MKSGRDETARGSIPGSSPRPDREHRKPQPTTCYTVVCVKTAVEISEESPKNAYFSVSKITQSPKDYWCQQGLLVSVLFSAKKELLRKSGQQLAGWRDKRPRPP